MVAAIRGKLRILGQEIGEFGFFSQRNADHKKGFAPRSEKSRLFLWGFTRGRWCPVDTVQRRPNRQVRLPQHCGESLPRTRAKLPERVREKKEQASWFVYHATVYEKNNRIPRGHFVTIVRGESQRITDIKKSYTTAMLARQSVGNCAHKKGEKRRV